MGASVYVVTDGDRALAQDCADELGAWLYERRADWQLAMPLTRELLPQVEREGRFPVVLADRNDNTGGGSPGDSTGMLQAFLDAGLQDACLLYIVDSEAIAQCHAAGVGAVLDLEIGGKSSPLQGKPCAMRAEVVALSDGGFAYDGPMYAGLKGKMGPSAHIREGGVRVLLVTEREQPFDTAFARTLDLDPRAMKYIGVKSAAHFRAGFAEWAGAVHLVGEPGVHDMVTAGLTFRRLRRNVYPFDNI
jgi:microcystin degradation protein MlrC